MNDIKINVHGDIQCPHCSEWTNGEYIRNPYLECWNCGKIMFGEYQQYSIPRTYADLEHIISVYSIRKYQLALKFVNQKRAVVAWVKKHRDTIPPEAITELEKILEPIYP